MNSYLSVFQLLSKKEQFQTVNLFLILILIAIMEFLSIGSIIALILLFLNNSANFQNNQLFFIDYLKDIKNYSLAIFITLIFVLKNFIYFLFLKYQFELLAKIKKRIMGALHRIYLDQNYEFFFDRNSKELLRNIQLSSDFSTICMAFLMFLTEILIILFLLTFLFFIDFKLTLISFITFGIIGYFYVTYFKKKIFDLGEQRQILDGKINKNTIETYQSIREIKIYESKNFFQKTFNKLISSHAEIDKKFGIIQNLPRILFEIVLILLISGILVFLEFYQYEPEKNILILSSFSVVAIRLVPSISRIIASFQRLNMLKPNILLLLNEFKLDQSLKDSKDINTKDNSNIFEKLELKNINYSYSKDLNKNVFENISFDIKKGEIFGIYGKSGSGKSTLLNLITGLLKPNSGEIKVNSKNISDNFEYLRSKIGYVPQFVYLFDDTIQNNIIFDDKLNNYDYLNNCINLSSLNEFMNDLTNGLNTNVGEASVKISGGQKQRIGLARALYRKPEILILDEATNSIDEKTKLEIFNNLKKLRDQLTIIIISHDDNFIKQCDRVYMIEEKKFYEKY